MVSLSLSLVGFVRELLGSGIFLLQYFIFQIETSDTIKIIIIIEDDRAAL